MQNQIQLVFPQYRRYKNGKSYFCFFSPDSFEELQSIGSKWFCEMYSAKILPDRNFIMDMLYDYVDFADVVRAEEYLEIKQKASKLR
jgi:hypothetical protein